MEAMTTRSYLAISTACAVAAVRELPDEIIALLVDARACLDHSLLRAAVVLMGVAYEIAIAEVVDRLENVNAFDGKKAALKAGERTKQVLAAIEAKRVPALNALDGPTREAATTAAVQAYQFADALRARRNQAAHVRPLHDFDHGGETEEFLVSAGRHLTAIWSVGVVP